MAYNKSSKCKSKYAIGAPKGKTPSRSCYLRKGVLFSAYGPSAIRQATCNGDDRRQRRKQGGAVGAAASRMRAVAKQTLGAATRAPSCHIHIASAFIQKHKVTCLESRYKAVPVFSLLRHIENAPVHWHEETFSSGGILLSDENATVFLTSSDLQPVAPTQIATLNAIAAICFFFNRIKIFQASSP